LFQHRAKRKYFLVAIDKEQLACPITNRNPSVAIKAFTIMIIAFDIEGCDVSDSCIQYHHLYHRDPHLFRDLPLNESLSDGPCFVHLQRVFRMPLIAEHEIPYQVESAKD
jgi:hypothetical protein